MENLFNPENKFFTALSKFFDMCILSIIWILTVLAFVGPACTAIYYAMVKNIRRSRDYTIRTYFHAFKANFKPAAILGIIHIVIGGAIVYCYQFSLKLNPEHYIGGIYRWAVLVLGLIFLMTTVYVYPVLSRFDMKPFAVIRMSIYMAIRHIPTTLVGVIGLIVCYYFALFATFNPLTLILPSLYTFVLSFPMEGVLRKYMPKKEEVDENEQEAWYYE